MLSVFLCSLITISFVGMIVITMMGTKVHIEAKSTEQQCDCDGYNFLMQEANVFSELAAKKPSAIAIKTNKCTLNDCHVTCQLVSESEIVNEIQRLDLEGHQCYFIESMRLESCNFTGGVIKPGFLSTIDMGVKKLEIVNSNVNALLVGAFNSSVFGGTLTSLTIDNSFMANSETSTVQLIASEIFLGLTSLSTLALQNIETLKVIDWATLQLLAETLTTLKVKGIANEWNPTDLLSRIAMKKLVQVDLSNNNFTSINGSMFGGIADSVTVLYLQSSHIQSIDVETFKDFKAMKRLYLQNNLMKVINPKVFNNLLTVDGFRVNLQDNLWNCVCEALPLKLMILSNPASFEGTTKCFAPDELRDRALIGVHLCSVDETTYQPETTTSTAARDITTEAEITTKVTKDGEELDTSTHEPPTTQTKPTETTKPGSTTTPSGVPTTSPYTAAPINTPDTTSPDSQNGSLWSTTPSGSRGSTNAPTTTTRRQTGSSTESTTPKEDLPIDIICYRDWPSMDDDDDVRESQSNGRYLTPRSNDSVELLRPPINFYFEESLSDNEVQITFEDYYDEVFMVYYPGFLDVSKLNSESARGSVRCVISSIPNLVIRELFPSTVYTFCALLRGVAIETPFQCKSYQTSAILFREPWIYQDTKAVILTSFLLLLMLALLVGVITTYFMIRRIPTLMRGSKRVVMVNNRTKEVMVMPRAASMQKGAAETPKTPKSEAPYYLTPRPRQSIEDRPPFVRSSSETSIGARSYISVSNRAPPRFSEVFQPADFRYEMPPRCGSVPQCHTLRCSPDPIPPPLPRRSIASNASTSEMRKTSKNSIYRHSRIDDEIENHYNVII